MAKKEGKDQAEEKDEKKPEEQDDKGGKEGAEGAEGGAEGGEGGGLAALGKKRIILAVGAVVLLIIISVAAAFFGGMIGGGGGEEGGHEAADGEHKPKVAAPDVTYFELDEFLVNLNVSGKQQSFLKMKVTLELPDAETKMMVEAKMPRIRDMFQVYLRELRTSDLQGSAGLQRLREELLARLNKVLYPLKVNDILFKEIIVQ